MHIKATAPFLLATTTWTTLVSNNKVHGHGFLMTPISRNYHAKLDGVYYCNSDTTDCDNVPLVEDCPHCMNRNDNNAVCGIKQGDPSRNYDSPKNYNGGDLPWNTQSYYPQVGQEIDVDFVLTAHHKGHVEMYACPISNGAAPTEACFNAHPLEFVWDYKYGAVKDDNNAERVYVAPPDVTGGLQQEGGGSLYQVRMKLPDNVSGQVLMQWRYYTANSCVYEGYHTYPWPSTWGGLGPNVGTLGDCPNPLPDWSGAPERFWNCAEVFVGSEGESGGGTNAPVEPTYTEPPTSSTSAPVATPPTPVPVPSPTNAPHYSGIGSGGDDTNNIDTCCATGHSDGNQAANDCAGFVQCVSGVNYGYIACPPGLMFSAEEGYCDYPVNVMFCNPRCNGMTPPTSGDSRKLLRGKNNKNADNNKHHE